MKNLNNKVKRWISALVLCGVATSNAAHGGIFDMLFGSTTTYRIKVVDEQQHPIPAATIWIITDQNSELMARQIERYADSGSADYIHDYGGPSAHMSVNYTDDKGEFEIDFTRADIGRNRSDEPVPVSIAAIKRGYGAGVESHITQVGASHKVELKLKRNPAEPVEPRMLQFDLLRAQAQRSESYGPLSEDRNTLLTRVHKEIENLAQEFEREGRQEASILYHYLAWMPSVDWARDRSGKMVIVGYTNGYEEKDPQRHAYLKKAYRLNRSNPQIAWESMVAEYKAQGVEFWGMYNEATNVWNARSQQHDELVVRTETYVAEHSGYMWPKVYYDLMMAYGVVQRNPGKACEMLNTLYRFEPEYFSKEQWIERIEYIKRGAQEINWKELKKTNPGLERKDVPLDFSCEVPGLK